mmetsp:Transcript_14001/g.38321  ORF Transcript_14001/g.38321 Transcript_14001/m.38321 type:complete len:243 (+) Transcript_14001:695-1423(+)
MTMLPSLFLARIMIEGSDSALPIIHDRLRNDVPMLKHTAKTMAAIALRWSGRSRNHLARIAGVSLILKCLEDLPNPFFSARLAARLESLPSFSFAAAAFAAFLRSGSTASITVIASSAIHSYNEASATALAAAHAGPKSSTKRTILDEKYIATKKYAATKRRAGERLCTTHMTIPTAAVKMLKWKYLKYTSPWVAWCSATESTSGLPVRVCGTKSPRTRAESGPTLPDWTMAKRSAQTPAAP